MNYFVVTYRSCGVKGGLKFGFADFDTAYSVYREFRDFLFDVELGFYDYSGQYFRLRLEELD